MNHDIFSKIKNLASIILMSVLCLLSLESCHDWLDVKPRSEIEADDNYKSEQGFMDGLTGVYMLMADNSLYGKELTYGFVDALAQYYTGITSATQNYYYATKYNFTESSVESSATSIWSGLYNAIANDNMLISELDKADSTHFTGNNYHYLRGEAYGLRAFLHFDLLRLFAPSYQVNPDAKSIPYVTETAAQITPLSSVRDILTKVQDDLAIAESELKIDPVLQGEISDDNTQLGRHRYYKFNYYAVKLLQARAYLYAGDYDKANAAAQEVINQNVFVWTPSAERSTTDDLRKNYVGSEELVFSLFRNDLATQYTNTFNANNGTYMSDYGWSTIFEEDKYQQADYRYLYQTEVQSGNRFDTKIKQSTSNTSLYGNRIPLMRISEAYYIAAECALHNGNKEAAVNYLNTVRNNRGLRENLDTNLSDEDVSQEIQKEYTKEFISEGQLFFYYKRLNIQQVPVQGAWRTTYVTPQYVLPMPDDEIEFGGRTAEH